MKTKHPIKVQIGTIYEDGNIDPKTGKPYYYKVTQLLESGCYSSTQCDEQGKLITTKS